MTLTSLVQSPTDSYQMYFLSVDGKYFRIRHAKRPSAIAPTD